MLAGLHEFAAFINARALDIVQPDVSFCGGITTTWEVMQLASANFIRTALHMGGSFGPAYAAGLHLSFAHKDAIILETLPVALPTIREVLQFPLELVDGTFGPPPSDVPGLGVEVSDDLLAPAPVRARVGRAGIGAVIVDVHGHFLDLGFRSGLPLNASLGGVTDVPMLQAGGVGAQLCVNWTPDVALSGPHGHSVEAPVETLRSVFDYLHRELAGPAGHDIVLVRSAADLRLAESTDRIALIAGMEGTDALGGDPAILRDLYARGLRHACLVHEHANEFGAASQVWERGVMRRYDPALDPAGHLTEAGRALLIAMRELGILVDVSHLVEPAFWEVLDVVEGPVLVSHGGARALSGSIRYPSDAQLRAVAARGGVVGASPTPLGPSSEAPGLTLLLDTVDYLVDLIGAGHVAIGTDFKDEPPGYYEPGYTNSAETPAVATGLRQRGHPEAVIEQVLGGSAVRLFEEVFAA